ncbi:two-component regulator propeller domain-containing protein [Aquimarina sp. AU474]|uniref:ligand-binding sensor domain-containing protein n=1 Tax=Aquimarina sp. AU474 TaxID=2108529 RepID=UPI000D6916FB|nr:two-component regulator propeller domain-containing protein [Aquimarina sp. AU474]
MIKIKLFTAIALSFILNSCNGQKSKKEIEQSVNSEKKLEDSKSNTYNTDHSLFYSDINNQISQVVRTIFQDSKGNIWFGGEGGAFKLTGDLLIHIDSIKSESGKDVTIKDITEDKNGIIWLGHTDGLSSINGEKVTNYYESDGLISNDVWSIAADKSDRIWIGTIDGVCVFNGQEFTKFVLPEGKVDSTVGISSTTMVHNIFADRNGTLWFSSNAGLFTYANNSLINISKKAGIQTNFVNEIFEDKHGELWVSTKDGLYSLIDNKAENITKGKIETGKGIGSIAEDKDGNLWFVSNQHYLYTYDGNELIKFQKSGDNKGPVVFQIFKDQSNRLWFVGFGGAFRLENGIFINVTKNGPW